MRTISNGKMTAYYFDLYEENDVKKYLMLLQNAKYRILNTLPLDDNILFVAVLENLSEV